MRFSKTIKRLSPIFLLSFVLFYHSLFNFFTNDDFFHFVVSRAGSPKDFLNFFNLAAPVTGFPNYRPLATQVFYFLDMKLFNLNPFPMHVILFILFFGIICFVYLIARELFLNLDSKFENRAAFMAALLYAVSATHFGQLYFLATQEIIYGFFFFASVLFFIYYLKNPNIRYTLYALLFFLFALASKEPAVTLPFVLGLVYLFFRVQKRTKIAVNKFFGSLVPYFLILVGYLYLRFAHYGFARGDSYLWAFVPKRVANSLGWYSLWSLNIPEMLVDFVGPGLHFNPNLFKFYSKEIIPIFVLFVLEVVLLSFSVLKSKFFNLKLHITHYPLAIATFSVAWFIGTLVPVLFLPIHKFTFYLTVPLFGVVLFISYVLELNRKSRVYILYSIIWIALSILTLNLTAKTNWIVSGAQTAERVYNYFNANQSKLSDSENIVFVDTPEDKGLPWLPTSVLKTTLSDNNFFKVFFDEKYQVWYGKESYLGGKQAVYLPARQFLGY